MLLVEKINEAVTTYFSGTLGQIELFATIASIICVVAAVKHSKLTWYYGALGALLFGYIFYEYKLYSDAMLQLLFYLPLQYVGWKSWASTAEQKGMTAVRSLNPSTFVLILFGFFIATITTGYVMSEYTDAALPYPDAVTTWMSIVAQILMIRKYWESWIWWIIMDILAIGIYFTKGLYVTSGLYVIFLVLATYGLISWLKNKREHDNVSKLINAI